jgi:hypothetical protein
MERLLATDTRLGADRTDDGADDGADGADDGADGAGGRPRGTGGPATTEPAAEAGAGVTGRASVACSRAAGLGPLPRDELLVDGGVFAGTSSTIGVAGAEGFGVTGGAEAPPDDDPSEVTPAASSHSATLAKTGRPAEAARARVAGSVATIDRRRLLTSASRDKRRKFIREVAIREPYGTTSATFVASDPRIRAAAEVISSSTSR